MRNRSKKEKIQCVECGSKDVIRKGRRKNKFEKAQKYKCKNCGKYFSLRGLENKTYPTKIVMGAISNYNLGYTLEKSVKLVNRKYKIKTNSVSVYNWLKEFKNICSYNKIRNKAAQMFEPEELVFKKIFRHNQLYKFLYHKAKIEMFLNNFKSLRSYIKNIGKKCPDTLFNHNSLRCSDLKLNFNISSIKINKKNNYADKLAGLALRISDNNAKRHEILERFMLVNDSCTIAAEVPVYLLPSDMFDYKTIFGSDKAVTGHIDLIQVRFGKVYVLDFKPELIGKQDVIFQLCLYALALWKRTGIPLRHFRCAWFDSNAYCEFSPGDVIVPLLRKSNLKEEVAN